MCLLAYHSAQMLYVHPDTILYKDLQLRPHARSSLRFRIANDQRTHIAIRQFRHREHQAWNAPQPGREHERAWLSCRCRRKRKSER